MRAFKFPKKGVSTAGVVTFTDWIRMRDSHQYNAAWASRWEIIPDKAVPLEGFRSAEHWQLAAVNSNGLVEFLVPGCKVMGWAWCEKAPEAPAVFKLP